MTGKELANILKNRKISIKDFSKQINITEEALKLYCRSNDELRRDILISSYRCLNLDFQNFEKEAKVISRRGHEIDDLILEDLSKILIK